MNIEWFKNYLMFFKNIQQEGNGLIVSNSVSNNIYLSLIYLCKLLSFYLNIMNQLINNNKNKEIKYLLQIILVINQF